VLTRAAEQTGLSVDDKGNLVKLPNFKMPPQVEGTVI
jgi:hypothetical protein